MIFDSDGDYTPIQLCLFEHKFAQHSLTSNSTVYHVMTKTNRNSRMNALVHTYTVEELCNLNAEVAFLILMMIYFWD